MEYFAPTSLKQAEQLKNKYSKSLYMGGGTVINWKNSPKTDAVIDIKRLPLNFVRFKSNKLLIGSLVTIQSLVENDKIPPALKQAAEYVTSINIRNMATVGGSASGKFFVSHLLPVLIAYKADLEYYRNGKKNRSSLENWLKTKQGLICAVSLNVLDRVGIVREEKINAIDFPSIVTAAGFKIERGIIKEPVLTVSGASSVISISKAAAWYLNGKKADGIDCITLAKTAFQDIRFAGNVKMSSRVKKRVVESHIKEIVSEIKQVSL